MLLLLLVCSCEEILLEVDISENRPELFAPSNSSIVTASNISFEWDKVEGATSYRIQIVSPGFENVDQFLVNEILEETNFNRNLIPGKYEWRVTAFNGSYESKSTTASFEVENNEDFSASEVVLIRPENGIETNIFLQNLEWESIENASSYRLQIYEDEELIFEAATDTTNFEFSFENGEFNWRVRAETEIENTFYSENSIVVDTIKPNIAQLIAPINDTILSINSINFEWERELTLGTNVIDSIYIFDDINFENLIEKNSGTGSYNTILEREHTYYWFVRSFDEAGNESMSSKNFSFTIN